MKTLKGKASITYAGTDPSYMNTPPEGVDVEVLATDGGTVILKWQTMDDGTVLSYTQILAAGGQVIELVSDEELK